MSGRRALRFFVRPRGLLERRGLGERPPLVLCATPSSSTPGIESGTRCRASRGKSPSHHFRPLAPAAGWSSRGSEAGGGNDRPGFGRGFLMGSLGATAGFSLRLDLQQFDGPRRTYNAPEPRLEPMAALPSFVNTSVANAFSRSRLRPVKLRQGPRLADPSLRTKRLLPVKADRSRG